MDPIMSIGLFGAAVLTAAAVAYPSKHRHTEEERHDWPRMAKTHLPYPVFTEKEIKDISSRDDFLRAVILNAEKQWAGRPASATPNGLLGQLERDIGRNAGDILTREETADLAKTSQRVILEDWKHKTKETLKKK